MIAALASLAAVQPGFLFLAGGGSTSDAVRDAFLDEAGRSRTIVVLGQVREDPLRAASSSDWLKEGGAKFVVLIPFARGGKTELAEAERAIAGAAGIWVPGGDQNLLIDRFGLDWSRRVIGGAVARGAAYFGTSAGAMLASDTMIAGNGPAPGTSELRKGLSLVPAVVDSHFRERSREARYLFALKETASTKGIALSEGEWVVVRGDSLWIGNGSPRLDGYASLGAWSGRP